MFLPGFETLEKKSGFCIACSFKTIPSQGFSALEETPGESWLSGFSLVLILERLNVTVVTKIFEKKNLKFYENVTFASVVLGVECEDE